MQTPEELVKKITQEEQSLDAKLHNLEYFMMSEDFIKISKEQKTLLEQQHKVMTEYKLILIKRAHRINWEAGRDKAAAEIKKATEEPNPLLCVSCKWNESVCVGGEKHTSCTKINKAPFPSCFEKKDRETEESEEPDLAEPGLRNCWNCKHGTKEQTGPGQVYYGCDSKMQCYDHSEWEENKRGTQSN